MKTIELRPQKLADFIGKSSMKNNLGIYLNAAKKRSSCLDHILFYGMAGVGKTSLAFIIANELNVKIHIVQGNALNKPIDIINLLSLVQENDVVFIDEIHACHNLVFETLYSVMEDFAIDVAIGKEFNAKATRIKLPKFTLIGATTALGKIPKPLEERFGFSFFMSEYEVGEIIQLIKINALKIDLELSEDEISLIALNAKGIPRIANRLLRRIYDFKTTNSSWDVEQIFKQIKIYEDGLEECDLQYLLALYNHETDIGLKSICQITQLDPLTVETKIEPFLIKRNYITKSLKGRRITYKGIKFIKNNALV
ncbi:Holliday junction branch migration DNA helicase RuvB [Ureaplasma diversum]|uniref:Holliday junction branch migration complex subunit RuvB n=1 Tax=Ureaplasma diversum NCTC 246 TaxID=1188241 RepID=A0A084EXY7_9BACT|nr:Holliday junction branch migration DNA helicase RuvB [Ureaplasma diversum]KEZ22829.1 Holliday junction DNA helicase RuvB [Ureaplasma diversum NCTC 246]